MIIPNSPLLWLKWIFIGNRERQEKSFRLLVSHGV